MAMFCPRQIEPIVAEQLFQFLRQPGQTELWNVNQRRILGDLNVVEGQIRPAPLWLDTYVDHISVMGKSLSLIEQPKISLIGDKAIIPIMSFTGKTASFPTTKLKKSVLTLRGQFGQLHKPSVLEELLKQTCLRQSTLFVPSSLQRHCPSPDVWIYPDADMLEF